MPIGHIAGLDAFAIPLSFRERGVRKSHLNVSQRKDPPHSGHHRFIFNHSSSILSVITTGSWKTTMKRTKSINHASFRKSWNARHLTPVALAVTAVFMLAGCEKSDETVSLYQNADDCSLQPATSAECKTAIPTP
jgi:hypothetical protein